MPKIYALFCSLLLLIGSASASRAQAPAWSTATTGGAQLAGVSTTTATATDAAGNVLVAGFFTGEVAFGSIRLTSASLSYNDLFVAKYVPATGTWAWAQRGGGSGHDYGYGIAVRNGSVYVTGAITNSLANANGVTFGGTTSATSFAPQNGASSVSSPDIVLAKYTDNGTSATLNWTQVGGGTDADLGYGVAVSGTSVYLTGTILNSAANAKNVLFGGAGSTAGTAPQHGASPTATADLVVAKYTDNGSSATLGWTQVGGGTAIDSGQGIAVNGTSVYVTGYLTNSLANAGSVLFGGSGSTSGTAPQYGAASSFNRDVVVAKYLDNGPTATLGWTQVGGGTGADYGQGIAVSGTSLYVTGYLNNSLANANGVVFGGAGTTAGTVPQSGATSFVSNDIFVVKYTDAGSAAAVAWTQVGGGSSGDYGYAVAVRGAEVYVVGSLVNNATNTNGVVFGGTGTVAGTAPQSGIATLPGIDWVVAKYLDNGPTATLSWTQAGGGTQLDDGYSIAVSSAGVYVGGYVSGGEPVVFGAAAGSPLLGSPTYRAAVGQLAAATGTWQVVAASANGGSSMTQATAVDAAGNVFVTGSFSGQVVFGNTTLSSAGDNDLFVAKYVPATATWAWAQRGGGLAADAGYGIAVGNGSVYVAGSITNTTANSSKVTFGGTSLLDSPVPQYGASSEPGLDMVLAKYTDNGSSATLGWTQVGGGTAYDAARGVAVSGPNIYVTGYLTNTLTNAKNVVFGGTGTTAGTAPQYGASPTAAYDIVVAKYTDNGSTATLGWTQVGGGTDADSGQGIAVNGTSVYVTGYFRNSTANTNNVLFGGSGTTPGTAPQYGANGSSFYPDILLAKYTDNGATATLRWTQAGGGIGYDYGYGVAVSGANVYVVGSLVNNTADFAQVVFGSSGTTPGIVPQYGASSTPDSDIVLAKYLDNGSSATLSWTQVGGGTSSDQALGIAVSGTSVYISGYLNNDNANSNAVLFGGTGTAPGTWSQRGIGSAISGDMVVAKYLDNGPNATLGWVQVGGGASTDASNSVAVSGSQVYVAGYVTPAATFGSATLLNPPGTYTNVVATLLDAPVPLAAATAGAARSLALYPNPALGASPVKLTGASPKTPVQLLNALGQVVATAETDAVGTAWLASPLPAGMYLVRCDKQALHLAVE